MAHTPLDTLLPKGIIFPFWGTKRDIPPGWKLCDGTNDTPDLRGRFLRGAENPDFIGRYGGHSIHSHDINGVARLAGSIEISSPNNDRIANGLGNLSTSSGNKDYTSHTHTVIIPNMYVTGAADHAYNLPPFAEINYIMLDSGIAG